ncbi:MAG: hypothetical protein RSC76_02940 [Oscillospiraceae bacterium]
MTTSTTVTSVVSVKKPGDKVELLLDRALEGKQNLKVTVTLSEYQKPTMDSLPKAEN